MLTRETLSEFKARLNRITEKSGRKWGAFQPAPMLAHLRRSIEISLGDVPINDQSNIFTRTILRRLVFDVLPWPKGKIKAPPEFFPERAEDVDTERQRLFETLERFVNQCEANPDRCGVSPVFGPMTYSYWSRIHGRHLNHHLEQFGA